MSPTAEAPSARVSARHSRTSGLARRVRAYGGTFAALMLLSACAPAYPLYTPLQVAHDHGYSDSQLGAKTFQVTYKAPERVSLAVAPPQRNADVQARLALAYDMAIWRASQLALAEGYPAFTVDDRSNGVRLSPGYYDWAGRAYPYPPYYYDGPYDPYADYYPDFWYIDASVTLRVTFNPAIKPGVFDAADAIARLRARYPEALVARQPFG